jgi:hypothetical protein
MMARYGILKLLIHILHIPTHKIATVAQVISLIKEWQPMASNSSRRNGKISIFRNGRFCCQDQCSSAVPAAYASKLLLFTCAEQLDLCGAIRATLLSSNWCTQWLPHLDPLFFQNTFSSYFFIKLRLAQLLLRNEKKETSKISVFKKCT